MGKKISQFDNVNTIDNTSYVPIVTGNPLVNKKILANDLLSFSGSGGITNVTYSELTGLTSTSGLTKESFYKITDFNTVHYAAYNGQLYGDIVTGETEPLIVKSSSTSELYSIAYSELYPNDIIYYDYNSSNWLNDYSFSNVNGGGSTLMLMLSAPVSGNTSIIEGFKGVIYRRIDTVNNNDISYDFRNVKFRRWKVDGSNPTYNETTTYNKGDIIYQYLGMDYLFQLKIIMLEMDIHLLSGIVLRIMELQNIFGLIQIRL